jgi:mannose-1-phosphate guanylyltransferase
MLTSAIQQQLPELPVENIIGEPCKRDTAPCVGLAASLVRKKDADGTMLVMPSDHVIVDPQSFRDAVTAGETLIDKDPTRIVTFGIRPTYPAESFGYIEGGDKIPAETTTVRKVVQFREKPDRETAEQYLASGNFYWNSGIFLWRASTILDALEKFEPDMYAHLSAIEDEIGNAAFETTLEREFEAIVGKSVDYAVMERYENVVVVEAPFPWDDVGSWQALSRLHEPDADGNTVVGSHIGIDTHGSIIHGEAGHTIVTIDIDDLIVVQTPDATLVAPKHAEERVREAVKALEAQKLSDKL